MYKKIKNKNVPLRNQFVRGSHPVTNLDSQGMKMFLSLCYLLNQEQFDQESDLTFRLKSFEKGTGEPYYSLQISADNLARLLDIRHKDRREVAVVQTALDLAEKASFVYETEDGLHYIHPIYSVSYDHQDFEFRVYLPDMFQQVLGLKKHFSLVSLSEVLHLKKQSSIFLYMYLLSFLHRGKIYKTQITTQHLLRVLQMHDGAYIEERKLKNGKTKKHFKRYAFELKSLDPALKEISQKTSLQAVYSKPKTLKQYMAPYEFRIWSAEDFERVDPEVWKPEQQKKKKQQAEQPLPSDEIENPWENNITDADLEEKYPVRLGSEIGKTVYKPTPEEDHSLDHLFFDPAETVQQHTQEEFDPFNNGLFSDYKNEEE